MRESSSTPSSEKPDPDSYRFALWKEYEGVAMHFNDLLMRLRTQSLAAIGGFAALAGIILKTQSDTVLRWSTLVGVFSLLIFLWVAIWILDFMYYNRLLTGAVDALLEIETESRSQEGVSQLNLSTRIETAVAGQPRAAYWARAKAWWFFYILVFAALVAGLVVSGYAVGGPSAALTALRPGKNASEPQITREAALTRRELFDRKRLCMDLGERRFATDSKQLGQDQVGLAPTMCFSERLNTCLYAGGWFGKKSSYQMTVDLLANKNLVVSIMGDGRAMISGMDAAAYQQKSEDLLSTCAQ